MRQKQVWKLCSVEQPHYGIRFMALFADGSGGTVFWRTPLGKLKDEHGDDVFDGYANDEALGNWLIEAGYLFWLPLPDGMKLFFEEQK